MEADGPTVTHKKHEERPMIFRAAAVLAGLLLAAPALADTAPIVIKFSHVAATDTPKGMAADMFKKLAEERTKGRVRVDVFHNSQLYKDKEELEALQLGAVQMLAPGITKLSTLGIKEAEAFDLPFLFPDYAAVHAVTEGPVGRRIFKQLEMRGLLGLTYWDNGFKLYTANKPLNTVEAFRGLKLRIHQSKVADSQVRALGGLPQVLAFSEVYQALQTGVIDGQDNPAENILTQKFFEVQKYLTVSNHGYQGYAIITNKKFWEGLPDDIRATLEGCLNETTRYEIAITESRNAEALEKIKATGRITVIDLKPEERAKMVEALQPVYRDAAARTGQAIIDQMMDAVKNAPKAK